MSYWFATDIVSLYMWPMCDVMKTFSLTEESAEKRCLGKFTIHNSKLDVLFHCTDLIFLQ